MSQDNSPNYITCSCQHCNGHIKFDANLLRLGETRSIECPHCHLETTIFNRPQDPTPKKSIKPDDEGVDAGKTVFISKKPKSSKIELFLFELTRFPTIAGAILVMLAFLIVAILIAETTVPVKPQNPPVISYEMVAPAPEPTPSSEVMTVPEGAKMAGKNTFPQPVLSFLLKHQGFSLKEWLIQLNADQKKAFLNNLADVLVSANSKNLTDDRMEQMVKDFSEIWFATLKADDAARAEKILENQRRFSQLTTVAFGLFISLMTLSLVLVMLAIERNTRLNGKLKEAQ